LKEKAIRQIIKSSIESFSIGFETRHINEKDNPYGTINMKIHNPFIALLGEEIQYYTALVRSFDSALGNMLEKMAINIARLFYEVNNHVEGLLYEEQVVMIAELLEKYKNHEKMPSIEDYKLLQIPGKGKKIKRHESDYYLFDEKLNMHYLIELKIGGDLDNKKARAEKEALFEQYAILFNNLKKDHIKCFFATAYNRFGENEEWKQGRVLQFFSKDELLIGKNFWNFITKMDNGYEIVLDEYAKNSYFIKNSLNNIKRTYLG
jgi:hypothetical protein